MGLVSLASIDVPKGQEVIGDFDAIWNGETVFVTAVLERTCVAVIQKGERRGEKVLIGKDKLRVERNNIHLRPANGASEREAARRGREHALLNRGF